MKGMKKTFKRFLFAVCILVGLSSWAGMVTPLQVGSLNSMKDEFGRTLDGSSDNPGDYVQILTTTNSTIYPPALDGTPDPRNTPLDNGASAVGKLVSPTLSHSGLFSHTVVQKRPKNGEVLFVRVFNAATPEQATFYGDSQLFTINDNQAFLAEITATDQPLDPGDDDGDGLNNSWEASYGTNPDNPDTDRDGMMDGHEIRAGTDPWDQSSMLQITEAVYAKAATEDLELAWPSIPGKKYIIEYTEDNLTGPVSWGEISSEITATAGVTLYTVVNGAANDQGKYRIRLVEE